MARRPGPGPVDRRYGGRRVLVAGAAVAGAAAARTLLALDAAVTVVDRAASPRTEQLAALGARVVIGDGLNLLSTVDDVVVSPGFAPHHPLAAAAVAAGLDVYSEPELAWRLRGPDPPGWLAITGTNGKTTTTTMLAAILQAAGVRAAALGNIGEPLVSVSADRSSYDVLAVELSSFQLHWSRELAPQAGALLNVAEDHLDWHGSLDSYARAKTAIWRAAQVRPGAHLRGRCAPGRSFDGSLPDRAVAVGNVDDAWVADRLPPGGIGVTGAEPAAGQLGVVAGVLVDRAFTGGELMPADLVRPAGAHNVSNALHAAALALAFGVPAAAVRAGLAGYRPEPHRNAYVASVDGVDYVDDSKATNPHAAQASLTAYPRIVWIAGGQLKGVRVDDLVAGVADRLAGAVLLGADRSQIADALARHAPGLPVREVSSTHDGAMGEVVRAAAALAKPGDTVLLAPAAASLDMFASYAKRGEAFASAVRDLPAAGRAGESAGPAGESAGTAGESAGPA